MTEHIEPQMTMERITVPRVGKENQADMHISAEPWTAPVRLGVLILLYGYRKPKTRMARLGAEELLALVVQRAAYVCRLAGKAYTPPFSARRYLIRCEAIHESKYFMECEAMVHDRH